MSLIEKVSTKSNEMPNGSMPNKPKSKEKEMNVFVLLLSILAVCIVLSYIIPSGQYVREDINGRSVVVPDSFHYTDSASLGVIDILNSIPTGMIEVAGIAFFIMIIGGAFAVLNATGATEALIVALSKKLSNKEKWIIPILMLFFALNGALLGAFEETLPYIAIVVPLVMALGFDAMTGVGIVFLGVSAGFMSAIMNPFTIGVAQRIAELPLYSGMGLRAVVFVIMYSVAVAFVYRHAMKVKRNPLLGIYGTVERKSKEDLLDSKISLTKRHKLILCYFILNLTITVIGVMKFGWYLNEISGIFILFTIAVGLLGGLNANEISKEFIQGVATMVYPVLIIGMARAIVVVLEQGEVMDTILFAFSNVIQGLPGSVNAVGMLFLQSVISFIVPSGSGMAALTMPILTPLSDIVGITRQTAVLAFQFGDGIWNLLLPGIALAGAGMVGISYVRWVKWVFPLLIVQFGIAIVIIIVANAIQYGPF